METVEALALVGGYVDKELLRRNEYLAAENEIIKSRLRNPLRFTDEERIRLAKIGKRLGINALKDIACIVKPETIFWPGSGNSWQKSLTAQGSGKIMAGRLLILKLKRIF